MDVRDEWWFIPTQHCTNEDCYTFSHTAKYCERDQPRACPCAFDYSEELLRELEDA